MTRSMRSTARAGFSAVEVILIASILAILARALVESSSSMGQVTSTGNVQTLLQQEGQEALHSIIDDLKRSAFITLDEGTIDEKVFPYVFDDGQAEPPFEVHSHEPPHRQSSPGDPDFGPVREIVFVLPADADNDGRPDYDAATGVDWSADEISYVVVTRADGVNYLERRVNGAASQRIARDVERIVFDTPASSNWAIPLGSVRVRLFLRTRDSEGALYYDTREVVVKLRNGPAS